MNSWQDTEIGRIPAGWDLKTLDEIKSSEKKAIISGPFGSNISAKFFVTSGIPVVRGNNLSLDLGIKFKDDGFVFICPEKANELNTWAVKDDIIFTAVGTIGQVGILTGKEKYEKYIISNKQLRLRIDKTIIEPLYAFYWFSSPQMTETIVQRNTGSSVPLINLSVLKSLLIPVPSKVERKGILDILTSLDDKIDLLHRQNKTLEAMAETLFRQWFVEEAEDGWEETTLYDAIELVGGGTPKTGVSEYWDGEINWLSGGDISSNHKNFVMASEKRISKNGLENSSANLLPKYSIVISARGTVGKYCILPEPMTFSQSNYGIMPKFKDCFFFTYALIAHYVDELLSAAYGSVFDTITTNTFKETKLTLPSEKRIREIENGISPYFLKMLNNQTQIQTLTQLRDMLLPKLMSGEVKMEFQK